MTRLIIIRHGETDYNSGRKYCGSSDILLNRNGLNQARLLRRRLESEDIDAVYTSDLKRCLQMCREAFKGRDTRIAKDKGLREIDFGEWEGLTSEEIRKRDRTLYKKWIEDPSSHRIPLGEPLKQFQKRVLGALKAILDKEKGKVVAIVTHYGTCKIILLHAIGASLRNFWSISQDPACVNVIEFHDKYKIVKVLNDTSHLRQRR